MKFKQQNGVVEMISKRVALLFLAGLILSPIVSGSIFYHTQLCGTIIIITSALHSIVGIALVYIVIPSY